jgi:hypothetical protein
MITYKGKEIRSSDIKFINALISDNSSASRRQLSQKLCIAWNWIQANGSLRDMYCRSFMLFLHRAGYIELPPCRMNPPNPLINRKEPEKVDIDKSLLQTPISDLFPLDFRQVRSTDLEKVYNGLISEYHYLGYCHPVGEHLKYVIYSNNRPISCLAFSSAPRHIGVRDRHIGWDKDTRTRNLHLIAYNTRFLILPWVQVPHLASHLLGRIVKILRIEWRKYYNHPLYFLETFVDTERFLGTCYKAANWKYLGLTTGRGKNDKTHKANRSIKAVWGYPLYKNYKQVLTQWT